MTEIFDSIETKAVLDPEGNEQLLFSSNPLAVNEITISNAATTNSPSIIASGDDANIDLNIKSKGKGHIQLNGIQWPDADSSSGSVLQTNGSSALSFKNVEEDVIDITTTTDGTLTTLASFPTSNNTTYWVITNVVGRRTDFGNESAGYTEKALFRNNDGILTKVGGAADFVIEDKLEWSVDITVSRNNIIIQVKGQLKKTINWRSSTIYYTV